MNKIAFFLLTTEKYTDRQDNIINSWGKDVDLYFYSEHSDSSRNVLQVCDVNNVEVKQISIFNKIKNDYQNYEWYFFGDDDTFVNVKKLTQDLDTFDINKVHGQDLGYGDSRCWGELHYPSGGAGFLINKKILYNFFDSKNYNVGWSDVTFGLNMLDKKIEIEHNSNFLSQHPSFYGISIDDCHKYYTFHYVKSIGDLVQMNSICNDYETV